MAERTYKLIRVLYPQAAICESCNRVFTSRAENSDQADKDIQDAFDKHTCEPKPEGLSFGL
jgi:hypothetical protein